MNFHKLNMDTWERADIFRHFIDNMRCVMSMTADIDVTNLRLGKSLRVGDLSFEGLELVTPAEVVVCSVKATRASKSAAAAEAANS